MCITVVFGITKARYEIIEYYVRTNMSTDVRCTNSIKNSTVFQTYSGSHFLDQKNVKNSQCLVALSNTYISCKKKSSTLCSNIAQLACIINYIFNNACPIFRIYESTKWKKKLKNAHTYTQNNRTSPLIVTHFKKDRSYFCILLLPTCISYTRRCCTSI